MCEKTLAQWSSLILSPAWQLPPSSQDKWVNPLYVNHFWPSYLQILMQFLCLDMDVNYAYYQLNNFNGLRNISS